MTNSSIPQPSPLLIGVGASAGGLEAFGEFLDALSDASGLAIVFVQHLDPTRESLLVGLLQQRTSMDVVEIGGRMELKARTIYVCPPQKLLSVQDGFVAIIENDEVRQVTPIDHLFHSIAEDQCERGVGVILSGSGTDGTLGLKAISDQGGLTFAQDADSAKYDSMPRSAATTGAADHVLPPAGIAAEVLRYADHLSFQAEQISPKRLHDEIADAVPEIADVLMQAINHNFQHYKINTLSRRIQRRMQVLKMARVGDYVDYLQHHEDETQALFRELLIGVTTFFRDPEAFEKLKKEVLLKLFAQRFSDDPVRIWVAGCANGAEAYTIAIICREVMDELSGEATARAADKKNDDRPAASAVGAEHSPRVQIFASDIDERALQIARAGAYPVGIEEHVSPERLKRFFVKKGKKYQVAKEIRELVLFSSHNLISDPPFSRQDLITCRNLLIYLGPHLQNKLIPLFHYALRPGGYLFLGPSENITSHCELFRPVDAKLRISQRKGTTLGKTPTLALRHSTVTPLVSGPRQPDTATDLTAMRQRILLDEFAPKSCVVDESGQVLDSAANLEKYLSISDGSFQNNIIKMAASGLRIGLRAAIADAKRTTRRVTHENLSVRVGDEIQRVMITVQPMPRLGEDEPLFMIVFHDVGLPINRVETGSGNRQDFRPGEDSSKLLASSATAESIIAEMERELESARSDLDKSMRDMEAANEELKSSNEELLSMNEELQSANEELETSKEEIRAGSDAVARANDDLENLLRSTQIATVFLDNDLNIRSFTPAIRDIYSLIPTDIGRPLENFVPAVANVPKLPHPGSLRDGKPVEHTVVSHSGRAFIRRVLPYHNHCGTDDGIVVTFTDVTELREGELRFRGTFDNAAVGIAHVALDGRWLKVNERMCEIVGYSQDELLGKTFQDITHPDDLGVDLGYVRQLIAGEIDTYSMEKRYLRSSGESLWVNLTVSMSRDSAGQPDYAISVVEDIDDKVRYREALLESERTSRMAVEVAQMGVVRIDYLNSTAIADAKAAEMYAVPADTPIPRGIIHSRFHPIDRQMIEDLIAESLSPGGDGRFAAEHRVLLPDGTQRWLNVHTQIFFGDVDGQRRATHSVLAAIDTTEKKSAELDLADRESHLRRVINNQLGLVGVIDREGNLVEVDDRSLEIARTRREDVIGKHFAESPWWTYDPAVEQQMREAIERALAGEVVRYDVALFAHGDDGVMIDFMIAPVLNDAREVEFLIPSGVDIRERHEAEMRIKQANAKLSVLFDQSFYYTGILDLDGKLTEINDNALLPFGFDREKVLGLPFWETPWWREQPESQQKLKQAFTKALQGNVYHETLNFVSPDGLPRYSDSIYTPAKDEDGNVMFVVWNGSDVTEQVDAVRRVRASEERLRLALTAAELNLWQWDVNEDQWYWSDKRNDDQLLPTSPIGGLKDFLRRVHKTDRPKVESAVHASLDDGRAYRAEYRIRSGDGYRWVLSLAHLSLEDGNSPTQLVGIELDITERKEAEQEIEQARKQAVSASELKSSFVANMSHEIRTPMTAILGYADLIRDYIDQPEAIGYLQTIRRNGAYLLEIINDILDLSKIEAGKLDVEIERFEPAKLIEDVRSVMEVRASEGGLNLEVEYDGKLPKLIQSDSKRLKQILINLVGNAIKFTREGRVKIRVRYQTGVGTQTINQGQDKMEAYPTLQFDIIDTGVGMSDDQQNRLFRPFSQGDATVSRNFGGTGLGLAISQRLAEMLGGKILVSSTEGVGSTFSVSIAISDLRDVEMVDYADESSRSRQDVQQPASSKLLANLATKPLNCHVLVVDDRRDIRFLSKRLLNKAGATVDECEDGQLAVDHITDRLGRHDCPDLVLLDMQMPNLDGYETARALRKLGYNGPIIALTADAMQGDMNECIQAGCNDYLSKPIDANGLVEKVRALTDQT